MPPVGANTDVKICNLAIDRVQGERIVNLQTDTSEEAQVCRFHYPHLKLKLLQEYDWTFASRRASVATSAITPLGNEWSYQYPMPADFLALREIIDSSSPYEVGSDSTDGLVILTNDTSPLKIRYTAEVTEGAFRPLFAQALVLSLASELAGALKQGRAAGPLYQLAQVATADAAAMEANEIEEVVPSLWSAREGMETAIRRA